MRAILTGLLFALCLSITAASRAQTPCGPLGACTRTSTLDEYRHKPSGVHFYTACSEEKSTLGNLPDLFETTGRKIPFEDATGASSTSIVRFYFSGGILTANRHFYTSIPDEVANLSIPGLINDFTLCSEGERGRAYMPQGLAIKVSTADPRLKDISSTSAYCLQGEMPIWRILQKNPAQHRLSVLFSDYESDRAKEGSSDEGVRMCVRAPWVNVRTGIVGPSSALLTDQDREVSIQITAPDTVTALRLSVALPPQVQIMGYTDVLSGGVCSLSSTTTNGQHLICNLAAASTLTRSGKILLRATPAYNPSSPGQIKVLAVSATAPETAFTAYAASACTDADRPIYGCSIVRLSNTPAAPDLPSFTIGPISVSGLTPTETGGRGTLLVPITTTSAADSGKPIRIFSEVSAVGGGVFTLAGKNDYSLPPNGQTEVFQVPIDSNYNPADLRACVSTPTLATGFLPRDQYQGGCNDPAKNRKSNILSNQSFGSAPPPITLQVGVYNLPPGTVGNSYLGRFYCIGPSGLVCEAIGLPSGLSLSCGPRLGTIIDCDINGTPTIAAVYSVTLRASAPGQATSSIIRTIEIGGATPPVQLNVNLGNLFIDGIEAGSPNRFRVNIQAQSDPPGAVSLTVYLKESSSSTWSPVGGQSGVGLNIAPQTFTFDINTAASSFSVRVCARKPFGSTEECLAESPSSKPSGPLPVYITSAPISIGSPPAQLLLAWANQPATASLGTVANYSLNISSQVATNPVVGPLWLHIGIPTNWALDASTSTGCTQSEQKASCQVIAAGPLSATSPVVMNFGLKPNPGSGGVSASIPVMVNSSSTPPVTLTCAAGSTSCLLSNPVVPGYYDLIPQASNATPPATGATASLQCLRNGTLTPPNDASCRVGITYSDNTTETSVNVPYAGDVASIVLCGDSVPGTATCNHRLASGKTVKIMQLTALDGSIAQDNNPSNNSRVIFDATPPPPPVINTSGMPSSATQDQPYSGSFYCEGSILLDGFACSVAGLPAGLAQNSCTPTTTATQRRLTCTVSGVPSTAGTFTLTYTASASNVTTVTASSSLNVAPPVMGCTADNTARLIEEIRPVNSPIRLRTLANGVHYIKIAPSPDWRLGKATFESVSLIFEGVSASDADRTIAISMCPGDTTADEQTFNVLAGEATMGGQIYFYQLPTGSPAEPSNFPSKRTNGLPGLGSSTPWYINIRQTRCVLPGGVCRFNYELFP